MARCERANTFILAACLGGRLHLTIKILMRLAELGAGAADFGTFATQMFVVRRLPGHEVGCRDANLGTVQKGYKVVLLGMLGAPVQNVGNRLRAGAVTIQAILNARRHIHRWLSLR